MTALICATVFVTVLVNQILIHAKADTAPPPINIANVVGLANALNLRPQMGVDFQAGRAVIINQSGQLDGVTGALSDCVLVDGLSGACGGSGKCRYQLRRFRDAGRCAECTSNATFTVQASPNPSSSLKIYRNGMRLSLGSDYQLVGKVITFVSSAPLSSDTLVADYRY